MIKFMAANVFKYTKAIVSGIPNSLAATAVRMDGSDEPVNLEKARQQHKNYVQVLTELVGEIHVIPADEQFPDCVFVEDPVVVCGDTALVTSPGHKSRRGETVAMKEAVTKLGLNVVEMTEPGRMDGGDVLFTGREFFVGQSARTNEEGLKQLAAAFPSYPVTGVKVIDSCLHLKSMMSMVVPDNISIGGTSQAAAVAKEIMERDGHFKYNFLSVPDDFGANCLFVNGTVVYVSKEPYPKSFEVFEKLSLPGFSEKIAVNISELHKVDGCLTCCSVLIN